MVFGGGYNFKSFCKTKNNLTVPNACSDDWFGLLVCILDQAQRVARVSRSHVVKKMLN